jgi:phage terminase Nu1 subunit (DNA packaging protein)
MKRPKKKTGLPSENGHVETRAELAKILGISRPTLYTWSKLDGAPIPMPDGRHDVAAWKAFADARLNPEPSESQELRIENLRLQVSLKQVQLMKLAGDLVPLEWAKGLVADHAIKTRNIILAAPIAQADRDSLIEQLAAISSDNFIAGLRAQIGEERESE